MERTRQAALTGPTGGRVLQAQSSPQLDAALTSLLWDAGIVGEHHELTLLVAAAALLLLAIAAAPTGRPAGHHRRRRPGSATPSRLARWPGIPRDPLAELGHRRPRPPPSRQPDHRASHQPAVPPRRTRRATPSRARAALSKSFRLDLTACESRKPGALSAPASYFTPLGADCEATLNLPLLKQQAKRARLPVTELTALAILHEQEQCLRQDGITLAPFTAEQRLVRKLRQAANGLAGSRHPPRPP